MESQVKNEKKEKNEKNEKLAFVLHHTKTGYHTFSSMIGKILEKNPNSLAKDLPQLLQEELMANPRENVRIVEAKSQRGEMTISIDIKDKKDENETDNIQANEN